MDKMWPQVKGKENFISISGCLWNFLQESFHCEISHQCLTGSTYWEIELGELIVILRLFIWYILFDLLDYVIKYR